MEDYFARPPSPEPAMHGVFTFPSDSLSTVALALVAALPCGAQCALQVAPSAPAPGVTASVYSSCMWDPDGAGPLAPRFVAGGDFAVAGAVVANGLAAYDLVTGQWSAFGSGPGGRVQTIVPLGNGELVVAGAQIGSTSTAVKKWNGTAWSQLGGTFALAGQVVVEQLAALPNGGLVACGSFTSIGGAARQHVARWDGTAWQPLGSGLDARALSLAVLPNGDVVVGGSFTTAGGVASPYAARWDGTQWQPMTAGLGTWVEALLVRTNGELVAAAGADVLRWTGSAWVPVGPSLGFLILTLAESASGQLLAGGDTLGGVRGFNGTAWPAVTTATGRIQYTMTSLPNGHVAVGGTFGGWLRVWTGANWLSLGIGLTHIAGMAVAADGSVYASGLFPSGAQPAIAARWNGTTFQPLPGPTGLYAPAIAPVAGGGVMVLVSSGATWYWSGASWTLAPNGLGMTCLGNGHDGRLYGAVLDGILTWNGASWAPHLGGFTGQVTRLIGLPDGSFVIAGWLDFGGGLGDRLARWDGQAWTVLADVWVGAFAMVGGELVVGGGFNTIGGVPAQNVARWDGAAWHALGAGVATQVGALVPLPDGDLIAAHTFLLDGRLSRWDGTTWSTLATTANGGIAAAVFGDGQLFAGGTFETLGGQPAVTWGRLVTPCPATIAAAGAGCAGSGGANVLVTSAPWIGSTVRSETSGLVANSIALAAWGVSPVSLPLPLLLPVGVPGCTLWVLPDFVAAVQPVNGVAVTSLPVPSSLALVGASLSHQVVALELGVAGSITAASASNAALLTLGAF